MKNLIDSKINFSVVTEDSLIQAYTLDASQAAPEQVLMGKPGNLYLLQEPQHASLSDALVAERSGEDLLLAFRSQEQARPALKFKPREWVPGRTTGSSASMCLTKPSRRSGDSSWNAATATIPDRSPNRPLRSYASHRPRSASQAASQACSSTWRFQSSAST